MTSIFGQVWLWSLLAFALGAFVTWALLVRPARQRLARLDGDRAAGAELQRGEETGEEPRQPREPRRDADWLRGDPDGDDLLAGLRGTSPDPTQREPIPETYEELWEAAPEPVPHPPLPPRAPEPPRAARPEPTRADFFTEQQPAIRHEQPDEYQDQQRAARAAGPLDQYQGPRAEPQDQRRRPESRADQTAVINKAGLPGAHDARRAELTSRQQRPTLGAGAGARPQSARAGRRDEAIGWPDEGRDLPSTPEAQPHDPLPGADPDTWRPSEPRGLAEPARPHHDTRRGLPTPEVGPVGASAAPAEFDAFEAAWPQGEDAGPGDGPGTGGRDELLGDFPDAFPDGPSAEDAAASHGGPAAEPFDSAASSSAPEWAPGARADQVDEPRTDFFRRADLAAEQPAVEHEWPSSQGADSTEPSADADATAWPSTLDEPASGRALETDPVDEAQASESAAPAESDREQRVFDRDEVQEDSAWPEAAEFQDHPADQDLPASSTALTGPSDSPDLPPVSDTAERDRGATPESSAAAVEEDHVSVGTDGPGELLDEAADEHLDRPQDAQPAAVDVTDRTADVEAAADAGPDVGREEMSEQTAMIPMVSISDHDHDHDAGAGAVGAADSADQDDPSESQDTVSRSGSSASSSLPPVGRSAAINENRPTTSDIPHVAGRPAARQLPVAADRSDPLIGLDDLELGDATPSTGDRAGAPAEAVEPERERSLFEPVLEADGAAPGPAPSGGAAEFVWFAGRGQAGNQSGTPPRPASPVPPGPPPAIPRPAIPTPSSTSGREPWIPIQDLEGNELDAATLTPKGAQPFGPGSAPAAPDGSAPTADYRVKANAKTRIYHTDQSPQFGTAKAQVWFRSEADAQRAGFAPWHTRRSGSAGR
ncbi:MULTISPECIES: hypothetical protein [Actinoalloteichus]|uniref:Uncharacterized protein n=1 Tax=Actinoalloteichus fjordicus TaxID=1612552 RepID=A0AAC9L955_9PSEU|nr:MULTISPECIES: hypothetical protein [Actinoalloteichus]APU12615.1 hypothetical protein UA74_02640 [Actinoalloteichus fjordicus]APU18568.1 hypothetical protein UA75_02645 [Actinoalloteichus sp. GBA129-24]